MNALSPLPRIVVTPPAMTKEEIESRIRAVRDLRVTPESTRSSSPSSASSYLSVPEVRLRRRVRITKPIDKMALIDAELVRRGILPTPAASSAPGQVRRYVNILPKPAGASTLGAAGQVCDNDLKE